MMPSRFPTSTLRRFTRDTRAVAAVEFAIVLPLMLTLYLGSVEVSQAINASRKVTLVSRTIADLASQSSAITATTMQDYLKASAAILAPFPEAEATVIVSCVTIDANKQAKIAWSAAKPSTAKHGTGDGATLHQTLLIPNTALVWSEVNYNFTPTLGYVLTGTIPLKDQMYMRPRLTDGCPTHP